MAKFECSTCSDDEDNSSFLVFQSHHLSVNRSIIFTVFLLRSRGTRERILILFRRQKPRFFGLQIGRPSKVFAGALGLVFVSTGHKTRLGHVLAFFVLFDLLRFSWNWFSLRWQSTKRNAAPVQTGLSFFDLRRKRTKSSQSTCIQDDLRFRSFTVARL